MSSQIMPSDADLRSNRADEALALEEDARLRTDYPAARTQFSAIP